MRVNVNVQSICIQKDRMRGIPYYVKELTAALAEEKNIKLSVTFYDFQKERNNLEYIEEHFKSVLNKINICECNSYSWRDEMDFWQFYNGNPKEGLLRKYEDDVGEQADVYLIPQSVTIPRGLPLKKSLITIHDVMPCIDSNFQRNFPKIAERFQHVMGYIAKNEELQLVAVSEHTRNDLTLKLGINPDRITIIPEGYNNSNYWHEEDKKVLKIFGIDSPYLLYLGAMDPRKGIDTICDAFSKIRNKDVKLVLAGGVEPGYDITPLINKCRDNNGIIQTGYVSDRQKRVLMSMSEIFLFPSRYEGFGLPVIEAMACGTPVITARNSSLPEVGGDAACYIETGNSEELAIVIDELLESKELRNKHIEAGRSHIKKFSWKKTADMYKALMTKMISDYKE